MKITIRDISFEVADHQDDPFWKYVDQGHWEPSTFAMIESLVEEGQTFIDIGAWIGPLTLFAAAKRIKVIAVEPDAVARQKLVQNIRLNLDLKDSIKVVPVAVSTHSASSFLHARSQYGTSSSSLLKRIRDRVSKQEVKTLTLEDLIRDLGIGPEQIGLVKIDIEGGEFDILPSMTATFQKMKIPTVMVSFHFGHLVEHFYEKVIGIRLISLALMKLEDSLGFSFFQHQILTKTNDVLQSMNHYRYLFTPTGAAINRHELEAKPWKFPDIVFTNQPWPESQVK